MEYVRKNLFNAWKKVETNWQKLKTASLFIKTPSLSVQTTSLFVQTMTLFIECSGVFGTFCQDEMKLSCPVPTVQTAVADGFRQVVRADFRGLFEVGYGT